jgi:hypothetical protein
MAGARRVATLCLVIAAAGCRQVLGIHELVFDEAGAGGGSTASTTTGSATTSTGTGTGSTSSGQCSVDHLLISEIRTRGAGGSVDEYVVLYNPTGADVSLDSSWALGARGTSAAVYTVRWMGTGATLGAHRHYLVAGAGYVQSPPPDAQLASGLTDAGGLTLLQGATAVDTVCYAYDITTVSALMFGGYSCAGAPAINPHDDTTATDVDTSIVRRPGGALGNCMDTGDNMTDFAVQTPGTPADLASPAAP